MAVKVTLRQKKIKNGLKSLYLDYYPPIINKKGKETRREFLKMYIHEKPLNAKEKSHNKTTWEIAEKIRESRALSIYNKEYGFKQNVTPKIDFVNYFKEIVDEKYDSTTFSNYQSWLASYHYYKSFADKIYSDRLDKKHIEKFKVYLKKVKSNKTKKTLSISTVATYFKNFLHVVDKAYQDDILKENFTKGIKNVKVEYQPREYLTKAELKKLWKTPTENITFKYLCFFCVYTGFRFNEAKKLKWEDISQDDSGNKIVRLYHSKGKKYTINPISEEAYQLLKGIGAKNRTDRIFDIEYSVAYRLIKKWVKDAKILKNITLHNLRHTYAVLQLEAGTDYYTLSKMLGHENISTTKVYAKITDHKKIETLDKIKIDFDEID